MSMRHATFGGFDSQTIHGREQPARRLGVIVSIIFLLSLSSVATLTSVRAKAAEHDSTRASMIALPSSSAR
jgi:hypothetical protein